MEMILNGEVRPLPVRSGFTLMEMVLYLAIAGVMIGGILVAMQLVRQGQVSQRVAVEVDQQAGLVLERFTSMVMDADGVTSPAFGQSAVSLTLSDGTVMNISNGQVILDTPSLGAIALTSSRVLVTSPSFSNLTTSSSADIVQFQFTISSAATSSLQEYGYERTYVTSAQRRNE